MKKLCCTCYDQEGCRIFSVGAKHIDITDSATIINDIEGTNNKTLRFFHHISSFNIVSGTITIYYVCGNYMTITQK
jgi:hypothetical protein